MKKLSKVDREALERALELDRDRDPSSSSPNRRLDPDRWFEAAHKSAYSCQVDVLNPAPWEPVPCNDYVSGPAAELLRRLLAASLSRFEPSPIEALARVEAERTASAALGGIPKDPPKDESSLEEGKSDVESVTTPGPSAG